MEKWPNLFIVGAPKAGTTSLYHYFNQVPGIYMSPVKEPNFFSAKTRGEKHPAKPIRDKKKYLRLFMNNKNSFLNFTEGVVDLSLLEGTFRHPLIQFLQVQNGLFL